MTGTRRSTPPIVLSYGLLGLIPFLGPVLGGMLFPDIKDLAGRVLALYGALILSFLGGARWGLANVRPSPRTTVISLSMLPTLVGLVLLIMPPDSRRLQLLGLGIALGLHWVWDMRGEALPTWYPALRTTLTIGAVAGLVAGGFALA